MSVDLGGGLSGADLPIVRLPLAAGGRSAGLQPVIPPDDLWFSSDPKGWKYKDKNGLHAGVTGVLLKTGAAGKTKVQLKAKGEPLPLPEPVAEDSFMTMPVTVQLVNTDTGFCWTSVDAERFSSTFPPN